MQGLPIVIDADGLQVVSNNPSTVKGYQKVILTPNAPELWRLADALGVQHNKQPPHKDCNTVQVRITQ